MTLVGVLAQQSWVNALSYARLVPNLGRTWHQIGRRFLNQNSKHPSFFPQILQTSDICRYLHALFVAIDGNFRLKRKQVSSDALDPGLGQGHAYFVEETAYKDYLKLHENDPKPVS